MDHLNQLEKDGIITPVKEDGDIRLVIDCKVPVNKVLIPNSYPLPTAQDLFVSLAGSKVLCSLDLATAFP